MRSKRLIIIFSVLIFLVLIIVLASTLFNLSTIEIRRTTQVHTVDDNGILQSVEKYKKSNLLFLSKKDMIETVKKHSGYIGDVVVEKVFPTTVRLHITERSELFAVKLQESDGVQKYYILDINGYILRTSTEITDNSASSQKNIQLLEILDTDVISKNVGEKLVLKDLAKLNCLNEFFDTLQRLEDPYPYNEAEMKAFIKEVNIASARTIRMTTYAGVKIEISDGENNMANKVRRLMAVYNKLDEDMRRRGKITVYDSSTAELGVGVGWSAD